MKYSDLLRKMSMAQVARTAVKKAVKPIERFQIQRTQSQQRVINNSKIDSDLRLTPEQKRKQKSQIEYDDLPKYLTSQA